MAVSADRWLPIPPLDGVEDGAMEVFVGTVPSLASGQPLSVRVVDEAGNVTTRRIDP